MYEPNARIVLFCLGTAHDISVAHLDLLRGEVLACQPVVLGDLTHPAAADPVLLGNNDMTHLGAQQCDDLGITHRQIKHRVRWLAAHSLSPRFNPMGAEKAPNFQPRHPVA